MSLKRLGCYVLTFPVALCSVFVFVLFLFCFCFVFVLFCLLVLLLFYWLLLLDFRWKNLRFGFSLDKVNLVRHGILDRPDSEKSLKHIDSHCQLTIKKFYFITT